jgi:hypothetical protein
MNIEWGTPTRHAKTEQLGARAFVPFTSGNWTARHEIDSHGMSSGELADHLDVLQQRHDLWAETMDTLGEMLGVDVTVDGRIFRITDCTIPPRPTERHILILGVRLVDGDALRKVAGWPIRIELKRLADVPSRETMVEMIESRLTEQRSVDAAHAEFVGKVAAKLTNRA